MTDSRSDRYRSDIVMIPLRRVGIASHLARRAEEWITSMTPSQDNEDGADFWKWIVDHHQLNAGPADLLDTYFFIDIDNGSLLATVSIVSDDRDAGAKYGIPGFWIGGTNVRREMRKKGIVTVVSRLVDAYIQAVVDAQGSEMIGNFFTVVPTMETIGLKNGYSFMREIEVDHFGTMNRWFSKRFTPREDARVS